MASNELKDIIDQLEKDFAVDKESNTDEDKDETCREIEEIDIPGMDDEQVLAESKKVSIFCRGCLSPYYGEKGLGGSIILKCPKCNHRDVITEHDLEEETLEHSDSLAKGGNLILNRFSKVLLDRHELHNIDVDNPDYKDDEFKRVTEGLSHVTSLMKKTFSAMFKITDDHRKVHNLQMIQMLTEQGQGQIVDSDDGSTALQVTVPIHGSEDDGDLVILPEQYKLPAEASENLRKTGIEGILNADKYMLNFGVDINQIENMPLFQKRLARYCELTKKSNLKEQRQDSPPFPKIVHKETETNHSSENIEHKSECTHTDLLPELRDISINTDKTSDVPKQLPEGVRSSQEVSTCAQEQTESLFTSKNASSNTCMTDFTIKGGKASEQLNETDMTEPGTKLENPTLKTDNLEESIPSDMLSGKISKSEEYKEDNVDIETAKCRENDDAIDALDDQICRSKFKSLSGEMSDKSDEENPFEDKNLLPSLMEFSKILLSVEEQKNLASIIPDELSVLDDLEAFTHIQVNEAFTEWTSTMMHRANLAKEQRMLETMAMVKRAARSMTEQVDLVQDEMLKELQIAYKAKQIKHDKQKKHLEETQNTLEHYRELIDHYQQTGQVEKLFEILDILRDYNNEN